MTDADSLDRFEPRFIPHVASVEGTFGSVGSDERTEQALRRHLERTDPATGLANRLVLVELLRSVAAPPSPQELVPGVLIGVDDLLRQGGLGRNSDRLEVLAELGRFIAEALPEGAIAAAIAEGVILVLFPGRPMSRAQAAGARMRALWLRRGWAVRTIGRPSLSVEVTPVPVAAVGGGWLDRLVERCRTDANTPKTFRQAG